MNSINCDNLIQQLKGAEGNDTCFDCGAKEASWASLNNGILLCQQCSQIHRCFGIKISLIRSLDADEWNEQQLKYLLLGGNDRFSIYLSKYPFQPSTSIILKYRSKAAVFYRKNLKQKVEEEEGELPQGPLEDSPTGLEGIQILDLNYFSDTPAKDPQTLLREHLNQEDDIDKIKNALSNMFHKTKTAAQEEAIKVSKKVVEFGGKVEVSAKQEKSKETVEKTGVELASASEKTKQVAKEGVEVLKKNFESTWSFFKNKISNTFQNQETSNSQEQSQESSQQKLLRDDQLAGDDKYELQ